MAGWLQAQAMADWDSRTDFHSHIWLQGVLLRGAGKPTGPRWKPNQAGVCERGKVQWAAALGGAARTRVGLDRSSPAGSVSDLDESIENGT